MKVKLTKPAEKQLSKLEQKTRKRIIEALDELKSSSPNVDLKKLKGLENTWRLRVGSWRVILKVDQEQEIIYVLHVKHRREAYR